MSRRRLALLAAPIVLMGLVAVAPSSSADRHGDPDRFLRHLSSGVASRYYLQHPDKAPEEARPGYEALQAALARTRAAGGSSTTSTTQHGVRSLVRYTHDTRRAPAERGVGGHLPFGHAGGPRGDQRLPRPARPGAELHRLALLEQRGCQPHLRGPVATGHDLRQARRLRWRPGGPDRRGLPALRGEPELRPGRPERQPERHWPVSLHPGDAGLLRIGRHPAGVLAHPACRRGDAQDALLRQGVAGRRSQRLGRRGGVGQLHGLHPRRQRAAGIHHARIRALRCSSDLSTARRRS